MMIQTAGNYKFKFVWWKEVINAILHIIIGAAVAHTFLPYLPVWLIVILLLLAGAIREYWQNQRGKIQPLWMSGIDAITIALGGLIWWALIMHFQINVDFL